MHLQLEINNIARCPVKKLFVEKVVRKTFEKSGCVFRAEKKWQLSLAWVADRKIQEINRRYRKKNQVTDVLSFCEYVDAKQLEAAPEKEIFLGELILCYSYIKKSVPEIKEKDGLQKEVARIISHGVLHLLGFSHGKKMFSIQNLVAEEIKS